MVLFCEIIKDENLLFETLKLVLPFLLGLFSSTITDKIRETINNRKIKRFISMYLKNTILPELPELEEITLRIKNKITNYTEEKFMLPAFESFNCNVLNGIDSVQYYKIFKEKYILLNEIISMIDFLSNHLPSEINQNFYHYINEHLREKKKIGDLEHAKDCPVCIDKQKETLMILESRLNEIRLLKNKIDTLLR